MRLYIKNMVCNRCIAAVTKEFNDLKLKPVSVSLGEVEIERDLGETKMTELRKRLNDLGFEVLDDNKKKVIEKIKNVIIKKIHHSELEEHERFSELLVRAIHKDYSYLSKLFSEVEGTTIEKYIINQKIEKVKELLVYDELNLSEISYRMGYSSVAHLSAQFKKITGLTPSHFKKIGHQHRKPLDTL
jgi:AraC family transcriptional regulator